MGDASAREDVSLESLVARVADEFLECKKRGERPDVEAYAARYPDAAGLLRKVLASLEVVGLSLGGGSAARGAAGEAPVTGTLGDYRILREVGRGGMGVVYEGEQISLGRRVALKVLPFAAALDSRQLQRFQNEARAAACLNHPNIVAVYAVGCERGVHYYAMQFIDGQTLADLIRELRRQRGKDAAGPAARPTSSSAPVPSAGRPVSTADVRTSPYLPVAPPPPAAGSTAARALSTVPCGSGRAYFRRVAELGVQAAEALDHAHQTGVVHRDVKPDNLLLDGTGRVWVTDFGLAHFWQAGANLTVTGDLLGTLRYMSPEQALARRAPLDHRTDIYSLGVTLYELLTLEPAFAGNDRNELLQQIAQEEPRRPRQLNPEVPAELETIVLKAMEKEPAERYATAQELAEDLRRFLEDRPVLARRPSLLRRATQWSRRHRSVVVTAVVLLLAAVAGLAFNNLQIAREQVRTKAALDSEAEQRTRAEENFRQAREVVDFLVQISEEELAGRPGLQGVRRELLEAALAYYQDFDRQHHDNPALREALAASHLRVANILNAMGSPAAARAAYERAGRMHERLLRERPADPEFRNNLFLISRHLGRLQGGNHLSLLTHKAVQDDLKLSESQVRRVTQLADEQKAAFRNAHGLDWDTLRRKIEEEAKAAELAVAEVLRPEQMKRLKQIALQLRGTRALGDSKVAEELGLTEGQKAQIRDVQEKSRRAMRPHFWPGPGQEEARKAMEEARQRVHEQLLGTLTDEQKAKWNELRGAPFEGGAYPPRGGPGPGRPFRH